MTIKDYSLILLGSTLQAVSLRTFLIPAKLASGSVSGLSQIINNFTGWPIGVMVLVGNISLFILSWRFLGGSRFASRTVFTILSFSILVEIPHLKAIARELDPKAFLIIGQAHEVRGEGFSPIGED